MNQSTQNNTLLVNVTGSKLRAAWISEQRQLQDLHYEDQTQPHSYRGTFCLAKVTRIEPALSAYFVSYLGETFNARQGFLPWKETHPNLNPSQPYPSKTEEDQIKALKNGNQHLSVGQSILVQVARDERGTKGAALTTFYSLPGAYLVLMPNNPGAQGISKKAEGSDRDTAKSIIAELKAPEHMGIILRTAGLDRSKEELQWDLDNLLEQWAAIQSATDSAKPPEIIYQGETGFKRIIRDQLNSNTTQIIIDDPDSHENISAYIQKFRPDFADKVELYTNSVPLFTHYQVQQQIESTYQREVMMPSGASIVIDKTEALYAIDVNSGKSIKGQNIEETALKTNLEAVDEITRQLKLRDIGGLIVIDFIDMQEKSDREKVEHRLIQALKSDSAKTHVSEISKLGLLEMSRQRLHPSAGQNNLIECPTCQKRGYIRSIPSFCDSILNLIEENAVNTQDTLIQIELPVLAANYLWNHESHTLHALENKHQVHISILANPEYDIPKHQLKRLKLNPQTKTYEYSKSAKQSDRGTHQKTNNKPSPQGLVHYTASNHPHTHIGFFKKLLRALCPAQKNTPTAKKRSPNTNRNRRNNPQNKSRTQKNQRANHRNTQRTQSHRNKGQAHSRNSSNARRKTTSPTGTTANQNLGDERL